MNKANACPSIIVILVRHNVTKTILVQTYNRSEYSEITSSCLISEFTFLHQSDFYEQDNHICDRVLNDALTSAGSIVLVQSVANGTSALVSNRLVDTSVAADRVGPLALVHV